MTFPGAIGRTATLATSGGRLAASWGCFRSAPPASVRWSSASRSAGIATSERGHPQVQTRPRGLLRGWQCAERGPPPCGELFGLRGAENRKYVFLRQGRFLAGIRVCCKGGFPKDWAIFANPPRHFGLIPRPLDAASSRVEQAARCRFYFQAEGFWDRYLTPPVTQPAAPGASPHEAPAPAAGLPARLMAGLSLRTARPVAHAGSAVRPPARR